MSGTVPSRKHAVAQPGYDLVGKMHFKYILLSPQVVYFVCSGSEANDLALRIVECAAPGKHPPHVLAITICPHPRHAAGRPEAPCAL